MALLAFIGHQSEASLRGAQNKIPNIPMRAKRSFARALIGFFKITISNLCFGPKRGFASLEAFSNEGEALIGAHHKFEMEMDPARLRLARDSFRINVLTLFAPKEASPPWH